jgi:hypothetical protein
METPSPHPEDVALIRVSKLDAASQQLDSAIEIWFSDGGSVAAHTLAAASHQLIHDIHEHRCPDQELLFDASWIKPDKRFEFINIVKDASNALKHADREPDKIVDFTSLGTMFFFGISLLGLAHLNRPYSLIQRGYLAWVTFHRPEMLAPEFVSKSLESIPAKFHAPFRNIPKKEFLNVMREALARFPGSL